MKWRLAPETGSAVFEDPYRNVNGPPSRQVILAVNVSKNEKNIGDVEEVYQQRAKSFNNLPAFEFGHQRANSRAWEESRCRK